MYSPVLETMSFDLDNLENRDEKSCGGNGD